VYTGSIPVGASVLVEPGDAEALAAGLVRVLEDRQFAERLSRGALQSAQHLRWTPDRYAKAPS
jgi:glycosyltransferase involved in cell wall biosynthesis